MALSHPKSPLTLGQFLCILIKRPTNGLRKLDSLSAARMDVIPGMNLELHRGCIVYIENPRTWHRGFQSMGFQILN
jgi:hypothetical protein